MDNSEDFDMGYTPARGINRSISDVFHRPWDRGNSGERTAVKVKKVKNEPKAKDPYLQELAKLMDKCMENQSGGCDGCPRQRGCNRWWDTITNEVNHGRRTMTQEMYEVHKAEFEGRIKPK